MTGRNNDGGFIDMVGFAWFPQRPSEQAMRGELYVKTPEHIRGPW